MAGLQQQARRDSIQGLHLALQWEKVNLFCLVLPSAIQNSFFPSFLFCH